MHINLPDLHPGRCKNYRVENGKSYRCVEYDNEKHECDFRIPWYVVANEQVIYTPPKPQPWVRPEKKKQ